MDPDRVVDLLLEVATLKRMPRAGWQTRGVPHVESVADHSFGATFVALALADALRSTASAVLAEGEVGAQLDREKLLIMAVLHDLAEVRLTDLPASAVCLLPEGLKSRAETAAIDDLLSPLPGAARFVALWEEFERGTSPEGRLVRDADKLEMMVQCLRYEEAGSRGLDEFWQAMDHHRWHYALSARLYERLRARRQIRDLAGASCAPGAGLSDRLRDRRLGSLTHDV